MWSLATFLVDELVTVVVVVADVVTVIVPCAAANYSLSTLQYSSPSGH